MVETDDNPLAAAETAEPLLASEAVDGAPPACVPAELCSFYRCIQCFVSTMVEMQSFHAIMSTMQQILLSITVHIGALNVAAGRHR